VAIPPNSSICNEPTPTHSAGPSTHFVSGREGIGNMGIALPLSPYLHVWLGAAAVAMQVAMPASGTLGSTNHLGKVHILIKR
jgi:hypothetical protein